MNSYSKKNIDKIISSFFSVFDNRAGKTPDFSKLREMLLNDALITKRNGNDFDFMSVDEFILPRQKLFTNGSLTEFHEWEIEQQTFIDMGIATRICRYGKKGLLNGENYEGSGRKHIQLLNTKQGWKIISVIWEDDE